MTYACLGSYANEPFYFEGICLNIFSIEELCYYLKENVGLLDNTLMTSGLVEFIRDELKLTELAGMLSEMIMSGGSAADFVCTILKYACYASADELEQIRKAVNGSVDIRPGMRRKTRGDFLFENGRYPAAAEEYLQALSVNMDDEESLNAAVYHNLGAVYARMFLFENAAACFKKAYALNRSEDTLRCLLVSQRLTMSSDEFAGLIIDEKLGDDMVNEAEALVKKDIFTEGESADAGSVKLIQLEKAGSAMREADKIKEYLKNSDDIISLLKADYRKR